MSAFNGLDQRYRALSQISPDVDSPFFVQCVQWTKRVVQGLTRLREKFSSQELRALTGSRMTVLKCLGAVESVIDDAALLLRSLKSALPTLTGLIYCDPNLREKVKFGFQATAEVLKAWVTPVLVRVAKWLGHILLRLLTPKEWKLRGGVGSEIFGLANASLEITFGYDPPPSQSKPAPA